MMRSLNKWYDNQPEPQRFLLFFGFVAIPVSLGIAFYPLVGLTLGLVFGVARIWPWR
jgi:hypothetical protein